MYVSYKVIGRHIRDARKAKGLTQEQFAERLGLSTLHYGRLERGNRRVSLEQLARVANLLDVPTFTLLDGCLLREPHSAVPADISPAFADQLARAAASCSPEELDILTEICALFSRQKKTAAS